MVGGDVFNLLGNTIVQPTGMLLHVKGKPVKAMCCQCWHLFAPTAQELESAAAGMLTAYICSPCKKSVSKVANIQERMYRSEERAYR